MSEHVSPATPPLPDRSAAVVHWLHGLLAPGETPAPGLPDLLAQLTEVFAARRTGLVRAADGQALAHSPGDDTDLPWKQQPQLLAPLSVAAEVHELPFPDRRFLLAALNPAAPNGWLLWVERALPCSPGERAALILAAQTLHRWQTTTGTAPRWASQLRRAQLQQELERASVVVHRLAHDYGNVLTSILGFSELGLNQNPRDPALQRYLQEVHRGAEQGAQFTNRLRMFARRVPLGRVRPLDPIAGLRDEHQRQLANNWPQRIRLELDVPPELPPVALGPDALREILTCLLDNAREAIPGEGRIVLRAATRTLDADENLDVLGNLPAGPCVEISIRDSGTGIAPEVRARLFHELFYTTKPRHRGLGLFIAYGLIASHRGGLRLTSLAEGGTGVHVCFPLAPVSAPAVVAPAIPYNRPNRERILVVDDDPLILKMVCATLQKDGYTVASAGDAHTAMATYRAARQQPFHLLVSDVVMPQINGVDLARDLLTQDRNLRLLFISGYASPDYMQQTFAQRPIELLAKPFRPEGLLRAVRNALDRPPYNDAGR